jgi:hypothetical protein
MRFVYDSEKYACKPSFVLLVLQTGVTLALWSGNHLSRRTVASTLISNLPESAPGRHMWTPIRSCFGWGLPSQHVSMLLVRSYRTVASLPAPRERGRWRFLSVALSLGSLPPAVSRHPCPMKLGLSSRASFRNCTGDCLAYFSAIKFCC